MDIEGDVYKISRKKKKKEKHIPSSLKHPIPDNLPKPTPELPLNILKTTNSFLKSLTNSNSPFLLSFLQ